MKEITDIKNWLEKRNVWELMQIMTMLAFLVGLTAGYIVGEYRTTDKIHDQLQNHITVPDQIIQQQDYFSLDGTYLYYLVKTNITIVDYTKLLKQELEEYDFGIPEQTDILAKS